MRDLAITTRKTDSTLVKQGNPSQTIAHLTAKSRQGNAPVFILFLQQGEPLDGMFEEWERFSCSDIVKKDCLGSYGLPARLFADPEARRLA